DFLAGVLVDLAVADAVASLGVDLVEADFLALTGRGEKLDRARDQRQTKKTLPISTRGHDKLLRRILLTAEILNVSALGPSCTVRGDHALPPFRLFRLSGYTKESAKPCPRASAAPRFSMPGSVLMQPLKNFTHHVTSLTQARGASPLLFPYAGKCTGGVNARTFRNGATRAKQHRHLEGNLDRHGDRGGRIPLPVALGAAGGSRQTGTQCM